MIWFSLPNVFSVPIKGTPRAADWYHTTSCKTMTTYEVGSKRFKSASFVIHCNDGGDPPKAG